MESRRQRSLAWIALRIVVVAIVLGLATSIVVAWSCSTRAAIRGWPAVRESKDLLIRSYNDMGWRIVAHGRDATGVSIRHSLMVMELRGEFGDWKLALAKGVRPDGWEQGHVESTLAWCVKGQTPMEYRASSQEATRKAYANDRAKRGHAEAGGLLPEPVDPWAGRMVAVMPRMEVIAAGWPRLCLQADYSLDARSDPNSVTWSSKAGLIPWDRAQSPPPSPVMQGVPPIWPLRPIWPGLLANTAFFGVLWLIPLAFVPALRRAHRRRRGRCVVCAYDLSATPVDAPCPECGGVLAA